MVQIKGADDLVVQAVTVTVTAGETFSSVTTLNYQDTNLEATITPSSTTSKILVLIGATGGNSGGNIPVVGRVARNGTGITGFIGKGTYVSNGESEQVPFVTTLLDSPSTTSATTYTFQIAPFGSTKTVYFNRNYYQTGSESTMTLLEIRT